jgi:lipid A disaccharide synthetase
MQRHCTNLCIRDLVRPELHQSSCSNETVRNAYMSLGTNGVDQVHSLRKIQTRLHCTKLCINGTSLAAFCTKVRAVTERSETPQNMSFGSNGVDRVRSKRKIPT